MKLINIANKNNIQPIKNNFQTKFSEMLYKKLKITTSQLKTDKDNLMLQINLQA